MKTLNRVWAPSMLVMLLAPVLVTLTANPGRSQETGTIQIVQGGIGHGTVTSTPAGINCTIGPDGPTGTCLATFEVGTKVRLKARAEDGSRFVGWAPHTSCDSANVKVTGRHECQPVFEFRESPTFLLQATQVGSGRITSSPEGIDCTFDSDANVLTGQCAVNFPNGSVVTLTATPLAGWMFSSWSGSDRDCNDGLLTMDEAKRCTATFVRTT